MTNLPDRLPPAMMDDLAQKAFSDAEDAIFRTISLVPRTEDKIEIIINIGMSLINNTLDQMREADTEKQFTGTYNKFVDSIRERVGHIEKENSNV